MSKEAADRDTASEAKLAEPATACGDEDVDEFRERLVTILKERGVSADHPIVEIRIEDAVTWWRMVQDCRGVVWAAEGAPEEPGGASNKAATTWKPHPAVEPMAKAWERLRKAIKEIEDMCAQTSASAPTGLASEMKPLIEQTRGVLEDAIEFQRKKRERAAKRREARKSRKTPQKASKATGKKVQEERE